MASINQRTGPNILSEYPSMLASGLFGSTQENPNEI